MRPKELGQVHPWSGERPPLPLTLVQVLLSLKQTAEFGVMHFWCCSNPVDKGSLTAHYRQCCIRSCCFNFCDVAQFLWPEASLRSTYISHLVHPNLAFRESLLWGRSARNMQVMFLSRSIELALGQNKGLSADE